MGKRCQPLFVESIAAEYKTSNSGIKISPRTMCFIAELLDGSQVQCRRAKRQMECCKTRCCWILVQCKWVLGSDKSHFPVCQTDGSFGFWRLPGEIRVYLPDCIVPSVKFGGGRMMACGSSG